MRHFTLYKETRKGMTECDVQLKHHWQQLLQHIMVSEAGAVNNV